MPQRIGEPVFLDEIGGMVLELVGACWRLPELAHTQTHLSNTFAEVCKYDSDHAADALPAAATPAEGGALVPEVASEVAVRDRPVFGEVRLVTDEVFLGQLYTVVMQSAHREPHASLAEHYGLPGKLARVLAEGDATPNLGGSTPNTGVATPNQRGATQNQGGATAAGAYVMAESTRAALRRLQAAATSPLCCLACISPATPLHLPCSSPASPLHLPCICTRAAPRRLQA